MQAMAWWLIPISATLLAVAWVTWSARPKRPADPHHTLAAHRRFTEALSPASPEPLVHGSEDAISQQSEPRRSA